VRKRLAPRPEVCQPVEVQAPAGLHPLRRTRRTRPLNLRDRTHKLGLRRRLATPRTGCARQSRRPSFRFGTAATPGVSASNRASASRSGADAGSSAGTSTSSGAVRAGPSGPDSKCQNAHGADPVFHALESRIRSPEPTAGSARPWRHGQRRPLPLHGYRAPRLLHGVPGQPRLVAARAGGPSSTGPTYGSSRSPRA
jgi:hypothetical protein